MLTRRIVLAALLSAVALVPASAYEVVADDLGEPAGTIVIITSERRLYLVTDVGESVRYRIAVGKEGAQWTGRTRVIAKKEHPSWFPPASIRAENPSLPRVVKPGPKNPLGTRAIYLAQGALRIHGTNAPRSIGRAVSHGCFRMRNADVEDLYERVAVGATVYVDP